MSERDVFLDARIRMAKVLSSDKTQKRLSRLPGDLAQFCLDLIDAYTYTADTARLEPTEVLALCETAARLGIVFSPERGDATLTSHKRRATLTIGFAGLDKLSRRLVSSEN